MTVSALSRDQNASFFSNMDRKAKPLCEFPFSGGTNYPKLADVSAAMTRQIPSPINQRAKRDLIKRVRISACHSSFLRGLVPHIRPWCVQTARLDCGERRVVDLARGGAVRRACGLTSGRRVERRHGWTIPTEGHALLKLGPGRAST